MLGDSHIISYNYYIQLHVAVEFVTFPTLSLPDCSFGLPNPAKTTPLCPDASELWGASAPHVLVNMSSAQNTNCYNVGPPFDSEVGL
jgi:hypothetical protein